jgi:3D (Asp-Asp-Asp) domain-containing protein
VSDPLQVVRTAAVGLLLTAGLAAAPVDSAEAPHRSDGTMRVVATAYCQQGATKSGATAQPGIVAADPRVLPIGTVLRILAPVKQYGGIYTVMDTGSAVKGRTVDIFMPSCARAVRFGRRTVRVRIVQRANR